MTGRMWKRPYVVKLNNRNRVSLTNRYREKVMDTLSCHIKAQTDAQQQTDGLYQVEIILNSQIKELDEKLQEQMSIH